MQPIFDRRSKVRISEKKNKQRGDFLFSRLSFLTLIAASITEPSSACDRLAPLGGSVQNRRINTSIDKYVAAKIQQFLFVCNREIQVDTFGKYKRLSFS